MNHADFNTIGLIFVALCNLYVAYISRKTEKNTNSMKDALVASTAKASKAEGRQEERDERTTSDLIKVKVTKIPPMN